MGFLQTLSAVNWLTVGAFGVLATVMIVRVLHRGTTRQSEHGTDLWTKIWDFAADYGLNVISIAGAAAAVVANAFNPSLNIAIPAIFSLLAIIVYDQIIRDQRFNKPIQRTLNQLLDASRKQLCLDDVYVEQIPFEDELKRANTVDIVANTMARTLTSHSGSFTTFLQRGGKLRAVMLNAHGDKAALKMAAARTHDTADTFQTKVQLSLNQLGLIRSRAGAGSVEVHLCDIAPSFGLYIFNRARPDATVYVRFFAHYIELDRNPTLQISKFREPRLFEVFAEQFQLIWDNSLPKHSESLKEPEQAS